MRNEIPCKKCPVFARCKSKVPFVTNATWVYLANECIILKRYMNRSTTKTTIKDRIMEVTKLYGKHSL